MTMNKPPSVSVTYAANGSSARANELARGWGRGNDGRDRS